MKENKEERIQKIIAILLLIAMIPIFIIGNKDWSRWAKECDQVKGYTCSIYEIEKFVKNK